MILRVHKPVEMGVGDNFNFKSKLLCFSSVFWNTWGIFPGEWHQVGNCSYYSPILEIPGNLFDGHPLTPFWENGLGDVVSGSLLISIRFRDCWCGQTMLAVDRKMGTVFSSSWDTWMVETSAEAMDDLFLVCMKPHSRGVAFLGLNGVCYI